MPLASDRPLVARPAIDRLPSATEWLDTMFRYRRRIGLAAGGVMLLAGALAAVIPTSYTATAALVVLLGPEFTARAQADQAPASNAVLAQDQIMKAEVEILTSPALLRASLRQVGLDRLYPELLAPPGATAKALHAATLWLRAQALLLGIVLADPPAPTPEDRALRQVQRHLDVLALKDGTVIELSFRHADPDAAAAVLDALLAAYLQRRTQIYQDPQSAIVATQAATADARLAGAEQALDAFRRAHAISDFATDRQLLLQRHDATAGALGAALAEQEEQSARLAALAGQQAGIPAELPLATDLDAVARSQHLHDGLDDLQARLEEARLRYQPDSRQVTDLTSLLAARRQALAAAAASLSPGAVHTGPNPLLAALELDRRRAAVALAAAIARIAELRGQDAALARQVATLDRQESELARLTRLRDIAVDDQRNLHHELTQRHVLEQLQARNLPSARIIQPPAPPAFPRQLTLPILAAGMLLSLVIAALATFLSEVLRTRIDSPEQLERQLRLPVLATVPDGAL